MINIVLMAGRGQRFIDKGYSIPKALISVENKMMFEHAMSNVINSRKYLFVINKEIYSHQYFKNFIRKFKGNFEIKIMNKITDGQATSLFYALEDINNNEQIFVSSCDVAFKSIKNFNKTLDTIFAIKASDYHVQNSDQFGWAYSEENNLKVSCKVMPQKNNDLNIIIGSFYFSKIENFKLAYSQMVEKKFMSKGEYYIDNVFLFEPIKNNSTIVNVKNYKSFGTPKEISLN